MSHITRGTSTGPRRLWLAVSGHGHGHLVQVTPLIRALQARYPALQLTVQSALPESLLSDMFGPQIRVHAEAADFGMIMDGPMRVLPEASHIAYRDFHADWDRRLSDQLALFDEWTPDLVIGDIPYLPLAAARTRGIPAVAVCSLNWADILEHYCNALPGASALAEEIRTHYAAADLFLQPTPAMPMSTLGNTRQVGPLIATGSAQRGQLVETLQLPARSHIVLVTLGGIAGQMDVSVWPTFENTVFLVPAAWENSLAPRQVLPAEKFRTIESSGLSMADLFASCDALITKPGYGAFSGAACVGLPVLYAERGDWPEEPYLSEWLQRVGRAAQIDWQMLTEGAFGPVLDALLAQPAKPPVAATGASDALSIIEQLFEERAA